MDKEIPQSEHQLTPTKTYIRITESNLPGLTNTYKASVTHRSSLTLADLAERVSKNRCEYRTDTLRNAFQLITNEIYNAIRDGHNVDFGLGRVEIAVNGRFTGEHDRFDPSRHHCVPVMKPSPRLRQLALSIKAEDVNAMPKNVPCPFRIEEYNNMQSDDPADERPFNTVSASYDGPLWIGGTCLKVMGDHPDVGVTLLCEETGEVYRVPMRSLYVNTAKGLCFGQPVGLTPGRWVVNVTTQYNAHYRLFKTPRVGEMTFYVIE